MRESCLIWRCELDIQTVSEANRHEHWRRRQQRAKHQRQATFYGLLARWGPSQLTLPLHITLTRIAPRPIRDTDNLESCFKHVRDGIADYLKIDDSNPLVIWGPHGQERGAPKTYYVVVVIREV